MVMMMSRMAPREIVNDESGRERSRTHDQVDRRTATTTMVSKSPSWGVSEPFYFFRIRTGEEREWFFGSKVGVVLRLYVCGLEKKSACRSLVYRV